jgi:hypothetical protein
MNFCSDELTRQLCIELTDKDYVKKHEKARIRFCDE